MTDGGDSPEGQRTDGDDRPDRGESRPDNDGSRIGRGEPRTAPDESRPSNDEPLGGVAEKVRERTGKRRESESGPPPRREGPLADVASEVDERRRRRRKGSDPFESVDVGELDGEKLWEQLAEGEDEATVTVSAGDAVQVDAASPAAADARDVRTIPKATCHGCPHFGEPPELHCTHEGTDILAMPDADRFRVADCPMVVEGEEDIEGLVGEIDAGDGEDGDAESAANGDDATPVEDPTE